MTLRRWRQEVKVTLNCIASLRPHLRKPRNSVSKSFGPRENMEGSWVWSLACLLPAGVLQ